MTVNVGRCICIKPEAGSNKLIICQRSRKSPDFSLFI